MLRRSEGVITEFPRFSTFLGVISISIGLITVKGGDSAAERTDAVIAELQEEYMEE